MRSGGRGGGQWKARCVFSFGFSSSVFAYLDEKDLVLNGSLFINGRRKIAWERLAAGRDASMARRSWYYKKDIYFFVCGRCDLMAGNWYSGGADS